MIGQGCCVLQEYGDPLCLRLDREQVGAIVAQSNHWKTALGLSRNPFSVEAIGEDIYHLRANGVTGVVRVGDVDIEVAPKFVDVADDRWKGVLWKILLYAYGGFFDPCQTSADASNQQVLSDLMAQIFLKSYNRAKTKGLPQRYSVEYAMGSTLGGSIDYSRLEGWIAEPWSIPFIIDLLSQDEPLAVLLSWAALRLSFVVTDTMTSCALRQASSELMPHVPRVPNIEEARRIRLGPQYRALHGALDIALLLLESKGIVYGKGHGFLSGFLWNSDAVYENFMFSICARAASNNGLTVSKKTHDFGKVVEGDGPSLITIPDVVFSTRNGEVFAVADAKYKVFARRPRSSDTYQLMAAGHILGSSRLALMYPTSSDFRRTTWEIESNLTSELMMISALSLNLMSLADSFDISALVSTIESWLKMETDSANSGLHLPYMVGS